MGTPPKPNDPGEVFTAMRAAALDGESEGLLYVEFSATAGSPVQVTEPGFWDGIAEANPSFPSRTPKRAVKRLRKLLTNDDDFRREVQGIWDTSRSAEIFGAGNWEATEQDARPADLGVGSLAVAVSLDLTKSCVSAGART